MLSDDLLAGLDFPDAAELNAQPGIASPALEQIFELLPELKEEAELYSLKLAVEGALPPIDLSTLDLETELATQLRDARMLLAMTINNRFTPANQKAQVMSTVTRALSAIAEAQTKVYNAERVKAMEQALIVTLRGHPDAAQLVETFQETLERNLRSKKA